jgi:hypothetical protein
MGTITPLRTGPDVVKSRVKESDADATLPSELVEALAYKLLLNVRVFPEIEYESEALANVPAKLQADGSETLIWLVAQLVLVVITTVSALASEGIVSKRARILLLRFVLFNLVTTKQSKPNDKNAQVEGSGVAKAISTGVTPSASKNSKAAEGPEAASCPLKPVSNVNISADAVAVAYASKSVPSVIGSGRTFPTILPSQPPMLLHINPPMGLDNDAVPMASPSAEPLRPSPVPASFPMEITIPGRTDPAVRTSIDIDDWADAELPGPVGAPGRTVSCTAAISLREMVKVFPESEYVAEALAVADPLGTPVELQDDGSRMLPPFVMQFVLVVIVTLAHCPVRAKRAANAVTSTSFFIVVLS